MSSGLSILSRLRKLWSGSLPNYLLPVRLNAPHSCFTNLIHVRFNLTSSCSLASLLFSFPSHTYKPNSPQPCSCSYLGMRRSNRTTSGLHASRSEFMGRSSLSGCTPFDADWSDGSAPPFAGLLHGESNFTATSASSLEQDDSFLPWPSVNLPPPRRRVAGSGQQHAALSDPNKIPLSPSSSRVESTGLLGHSTSLSLTFPKIHRKNVSDPTSLRTRSPLVGVDFDPSSLSRTGTTSNPDVGNIAADSLMGQLYSNMRATKASHQADIHAQEASHQSDLQESEATHQAAQKTLVDRNTQLENKLKGGARCRSIANYVHLLRLTVHIYKDFERDELPILRYGAAGIVAKALGLNPRSLESRDLQQVASALLPYLEQQSGSGGAAGIEKARIQGASPSMPWVLH